MAATPHRRVTPLRLHPEARVHTVTIYPELVEALVTAALQEDRSLTAQANHMLRAGLKAMGYPLPPPGGTGGA